MVGKFSLAENVLVKAATGDLPDSGMHDAFPETLDPINSFPLLSTHQHVCPLTPSCIHCIFSYDPSVLQRGIKRAGIGLLVYPRARRNSFRQGDSPAECNKKH